MAESRYWDNFWRRKLSRRRLLGGAALTAGGLAAGAVVGCAPDEPGPPPPANGATPPAPDGTGWPFPVRAGDPLAPLGSPYPYDGRRQFEPAPADSRGGVLTYIGFDPVVLDRYDPHQTQFGPMYSNLSAVFSKLYAYKSHEEPTWENIMPDLAMEAPEMIGDPPLEYVVRLRQGVKFHNNDRVRANFPQLAGRELTADDVLFSFERQMNPDSPQRSYYYRSSQYETIERMEKIDDYTIRFTTKGPAAPFFHFLADTNAMIIPREIVDMEPGPDGQPWDSVDAFGGRRPGPADRMIGSGPFFWENLLFGTEFKAARNPEWFGWGEPELGRPYLDGYKATGLGLNDATIESLFRRKEIDTAGFIDNPDWMVGMKNERPELDFQRAPTSGWLNSRLKVYCDPFQDWRVRRALHLAVDRQQVVDIIGSGVWFHQGPVGQVIRFWALPDDELLSLPGYRTGAAREEDKVEARRLYEAAGKPPLPQIWFADVPAYIPRFAETYIRTIREVLGYEGDIRHQPTPYSRIAEGLVRQECDNAAAFTWGFDNGWIDLDDWVYPYFKTGAPKNSFGVSDPDLDALLDEQRREFDIEKRRELGYRIQRYLLGEENQEAPGALCRLDYAAPGGGSLAWPYVKNRTGWPWFGNQYWVANMWFDKTDPSFQERPG
jgi:ABC-type transport system substrate-binding protein